MDLQCINKASHSTKQSTFDNNMLYPQTVTELKKEFIWRTCYEGRAIFGLYHVKKLNC